MTKGVQRLGMGWSRGREGQAIGVDELLMGIERCTIGLSCLVIGIETRAIATTNPHPRCLRQRSELEGRRTHPSPEPSAIADALTVGTVILTTVSRRSRSPSARMAPIIPAENRFTPRAEVVLLRLKLPAPLENVLLGRLILPSHAATDFRGWLNGLRRRLNRLSRRLNRLRREAEGFSPTHPRVQTTHQVSRFQ